METLFDNYMVGMLGLWNIVKASPGSSVLEELYCCPDCSNIPFLNEWGRNCANFLTASTALWSLSIFVPEVLIPGFTRSEPSVICIHMS